MYCLFQVGERAMADEASLAVVGGYKGHKFCGGPLRRGHSCLCTGFAGCGRVGLLGSIRLESDRTSCGGTFSAAYWETDSSGLVGKLGSRRGVEEGSGWFASVGKTCSAARVVVSPPGCLLFNQRNPAFIVLAWDR